MSDLNEREINIKINNEIKKYEILKKAFLKLYESESKTSKARIENFNKLNSIIEDDNKPLEDIYSSFIGEMKNLEKDRDNHLKKIMDLILPVIEYYPQKIKNTKKDLENFSKAKKNTAKLESEVKKSNANDIQAELKKSRNEERNKGETLENGIMNFESERCEDNKCLFLQFIHSELKYHAAALQKMSDLFYNINEKEPYEDLEKFAQDYRIEVDFENDLGINKDNLREKKEEREKKEKAKTNNVYESINNEDEIQVSVNKNIDNNNLGSQFIED